MREFIACESIKHLRAQLQHCDNQQRKTTILKLLHEELQCLHEIRAARRDPRFQLAGFG